MLLVHVPPPVALLRVVDEPTHTTDEPVMFAGVGFTVMVMTREHDPPSVYIIDAVPADTPVTAPDVEFTVTWALGLLHVPPPAVPVKVTVEPTHTLLGPVIDVGIGITVMVVVVVHPVLPKVNVITDVPAATPVNTPVVEPIVATDVLLLSHVPEPEASDSVVTPPTHTDDAPEIDDGDKLTVTVFILLHPPMAVYVITAVLAEMPVTMPVVEPTLATVGAPLVQVPPVGEDVRVMVDPIHTVDGPARSVGSAFTVTDCIAYMSPHGNVAVYVIVATPAELPDTRPVEEPTLAMLASLLLHVPPLVPSAIIIVDPTQTLVKPVIAATDKLVGPTFRITLLL